MTELADQVVINRASGSVTIDGVEFPFFIQERGPEIEHHAVPVEECFVVNIPVLCQRVNEVGASPLSPEQRERGLAYIAGRPCKVATFTDGG